MSCPFGTEHDMDDILRVGMGHVPRLRRSELFLLGYPALTRWAKPYRAYGAGRKKFSTEPKRGLEDAGGNGSTPKPGKKTKTQVQKSNLGHPPSRG